MSKAITKVKGANKPSGTNWLAHIVKRKRVNISEVSDEKKLVIDAIDDIIEQNIEMIYEVEKQILDISDELN